MLIILTFLLNAGLNFLLGLAVAGVLGPAEYGRFAIGAMVAIVLETACFDWLRLSATRYYTEACRSADPALRATLATAYRALGGLLVLAVVLLVALRIDVGLGGWTLAAALAAALANARFNFAAALARALFLERTHAALMALKNVLAFAVAIGAAAWFKDATAVLAALAAAVALSAIPSRRVLADPQATWTRSDRRRLLGFARYGLPVVAANVLYQVIALANRSEAAAVLGYADAGQLSLPTDMGIRLLLAVGAALDVHLFQLVVRRDATEGRGAALSQVRSNITVVTAVLVLLAVGYVAAMPAFEAVVVPAKYRDAFGPVSLVLVPGILAFCLTNFALNPVFQLLGRTGPVVWAALVASLADGLGLVVVGHGAGVLGFATVHAVSLTAGGLVAGLLAFRTTACRPASRDLLAIATAGLLAAAAIWPTRAIPQPVVAMVAAALAGTAAYVAVLLWFDVAGSRGAVRRFIDGRASRIGIHRTPSRAQGV